MFWKKSWNFCYGTSNRANDWDNRINEKNFNDFIEIVLTEKEKEVCLSKKGKKQIEYLCGRFTLKEAIIKAISDYENPHMKEIETFNNLNGKPYVIYKDYQFLVSISHEKNYTSAMAILLKKEN